MKSNILFVLFSLLLCTNIKAVTDPIPNYGFAGQDATKTSTDQEIKSTQQALMNNIGTWYTNPRPYFTIASIGIIITVGLAVLAVLSEVMVFEILFVALFVLISSTYGSYSLYQTATSDALKHNTKSKEWATELAKALHNPAVEVSDVVIKNGETSFVVTIPAKTEEAQVNILGKITTAKSVIQEAKSWAIDNNTFKVLTAADTTMAGIPLEEVVGIAQNK